MLWAAIETNVSFATRPNFSLLGPRFAAAAVLLAIGVAGHWALRRAA